MAVTAEAAAFIRSQLEFLHRREQSKPLIVALQGPQGSGKSYLAAQLQSALSIGSSPLRTIVLSIDDLYFSHQGLVRLAESHQHNPLLQGRGQPGTHDIALALATLSSLSSGSPEVRLPRFDKSKYNGEGDRLPAEESPVIHQPPTVEVVILEGWCVGFRAFSAAEAEEKWKAWEEERAMLQIPENLCTIANVMEINDLLRQYDPLWDACHVFIQLGLPKPSDKGSSQYQIIYQWRLEQENSMKASNGGQGMSDEAVKRFVDRYIPGYVFFGGSRQDHGYSSHPSLRLIITESRQLRSASRM